MSRVCLDCRSVIAGDVSCPAGAKHRVVDLATNGREKLVDEVWGPPSWRRQRRRLARAGGGGAAAGGIGEILNGCSGCDALSAGGELGELLGAILIIIAVALVAILVVWLIGKLIAYIAAKRNEPKPQGALLPPTRRHSERRTRGVVLSGGHPRPSPLTANECVGWAAELTCSRWFTRHVMLRDGMSFGFDIRLDDGRIARVPEGMLRLQRGGTEEKYVDVDSYVRTIDPAFRSDDEDPAIPYEEVAAVEIRPGDHVEIVGELHALPDPNAAETYRGATAMVLRPADIPLIRRV